ncbi:MAG: hypothetical protein ACI9EF_000805 [Pseudohongiellaceae bacterium]
MKPRPSQPPLYEIPVNRLTHTFDNGVSVYDEHLVDGQRTRYKLNNVHEVEEEVLFSHWIQAIPSSGIFVSVGCAIGYYIVLAKKLAPNVVIHAVEPLPTSSKLHAREHASQPV